MKKILLVLFLELFIPLNAQLSDLKEIASGTLLNFHTITELDSSVYGYFAVYELDKLNPAEVKFEYVVFDKNLNKLANGKFTSPTYKGYEYSISKPQKVNNHLILTLRHNFPYPHQDDMRFSSHWILDLTTNKLSTPFHLRDNMVMSGHYFLVKGDKIVDGFAKVGNVWKDLNRPTFSYPVPTNNGTYILSQDYERHPIECYDINKKEQWTYHLVPKDSLYKVRERHVLFSKNDVIASLFTYANEESIHVINPLNGKLKFQYDITKKNPSYRYHYDVSSQSSNYFITGIKRPIIEKTSKNKRKEKHKRKLIKSFKTLEGKVEDTIFNVSPYYYYTLAMYSKKLRPTSGLFKITLDKDGKEVSRKEFLWRKNTHKNLDIDMYGEFDDGYRFLLKDVFTFKDGSTAFLGEKSKKKSDKIKTSDLVLFLFDKDFNLTTVEYIKKDKSKSKYSDYLYAQNIKDGNGTVFFYADYKKDNETKNKNWVLGIVSIINGKVTKEQIPISSDKHLILPYLAKEGYILLREFNKDEDYDQIRLEKLNY